MVCYIVLNNFFYALWPLSLLLFWYVCKYVSLQSQVRQWCAGLSHPRSFLFGVTWHQCLYNVIWESILIIMVFQTSEWKIHPNRGCSAAALYIPMWVPCEDLFFLTISKILCMWPNSSGLGVTYMKQFLGVVGISIMFSLLDCHYMDRHMYHQE